MLPIKKSTFKLLVLGLVLTHQVGYAQEKSMKFSLQEAIDYALANNQQVRNAQIEEEIADKKVGEILADGMPQVNLNANLDYNYKIQQTLIEAGGGFPPNVPDGTLVPLEFGTPYTSRFNVGMTQMIFDGSFFIGLEAARTFTQLSKKDHIKTKIDVAEAVSKAYFGVLVNQERFELIERNYSRVDSLLRDTEIMYENGFAEKIDVNRVKVQHNNLKVTVNNYQQLIDLSESILKFQMGLSPSANVSLSDEINNIDYFDFELVKDFSYSNRVEFDQMNIQKELKAMDIRNIRVKYYPKIDFVANYGRNTGNTSFGNVFSDTWFGAGAVGLRASMPIFDGLKKRRQVQQRQLQAEQIDYTLDLLGKNIDLEIQQALTTYNREIEEMQAQQENMALAEEVYNVSKIKYSEGVGSNREVIDADATYKEAQTNYYNALYDALISKIDLQKAYGVLL